MAETLTMRLSAGSIDQTIKQLMKHKKIWEEKINELCRRLAEIGATNVSLGYSRAVYTGEKDIKVSVEKIPNGYAIMAQGESVLFVEFGAGITYGSGHPEANKYGMGPGTYPDGKGHWDDPRGWWIPKEAGGGHTYGNPPNPVMYNTSMNLRDMVLQVAREVFGNH